MNAALVLFDVDGTLLSTGGAGARAWAQAFVDLHGIEGDVERFSESGMTDPEVVRRTFRGTIGRAATERELALLMMRYLKRLPDEVAVSPGYRIMPGVTQLLEDLSEAGTLLGLVSGNIEGAARIKIARGGLGRFFPFGGYGTDSADRASLTEAAIQRACTMHGHDLDRTRVLVVGDTPHDVAAAHSVGAVSVGVATGASSVHELSDAGADHVLATLESPFPA
jgi:phosphoglycolate phosphatase